MVPSNRAYDLQYKYRLTEEDFGKLWAAQAGLCGICLKPLTRDKFTHVDHDPQCCTGRRSCGRCVRGLLCFHCNCCRFAEDPELLRRAADWFEHRGFQKRSRTTAPKGHIRQRGASFEVAVYAGRDSVTGKKRWVTRTTSSREAAEVVRTQLLARAQR